MANYGTRKKLYRCPVSRGPDTTASPGRQMSNADVTFSFLQCLHVHTPSPWVGLSGTSVCGSLLHVHDRPLNRPHASSHGATHDHIDHIVIRPRHGALAPPLSLCPLLRHQDQASCDLQCARRARRRPGGWCASASHFLRTGQKPASQARRRQAGSRSRGPSRAACAHWGERSRSPSGSTRSSWT